ncbi:MAG: gamma-glutamyltransferase [Planctomycetota bacterium]|nr:gamma-glutamyltransferase [Planctomycetota bacterium]
MAVRAVIVRKLVPFVLLAPLLGAEEGRTPVRVRGGLVVSQSRRASEIGAAVLERGGNAVDAAVATAFALAVTHPAAGNVGGGGFLVALLPDGKATSFDFREKAPRAATESMFLDARGVYDREKHHWSHLAAGVPGSVAGLHLAHSRLGRLPWRELIEPAVRLAAEGFALSPGLAASLRSVHRDLSKHPASRAQFTRDGRPFAEGERLVQADLARTLERVRDQGPGGFYRGRTADLIVQEMRRGGGLITHEDLAAYRAAERTPVRSTYRGYEIISMPPPSSGGVALVEMLNVLEGYDLRSRGAGSPQEVHVIVEAMRRAFADRARYLGDPDFVEIPVARLISKSYSDAIRDGIRADGAARSSPERFEWPAESEETTHLSVVDKERMAVSLTTTLEQSYGSRIVVTGAGFLLNNEMGDFNPRAGRTTRGGHIGTAPNLAAPGKRMLSSMCPTIVARDARPILVIGSPGGRTIINTVLQVIIGHLDHGLPVQQAIDRPRFHHQWLPDRIVAEAGALSDECRAVLEALGHRIVSRRGPQGSAMGIAVRADGTLEAGVDRRRPDAGAAGVRP